MLHKWKLKLASLIPLPSYNINSIFRWYWRRAMASDSSESKQDDCSDPSRDFFGHGPDTPDPLWPLGAKLALQIVLNYEEGAESSIQNGDTHSEHLLSDIPGAQPKEGVRCPNIESHYEYGSRAGFWRLHRLLKSRDIPITVFACGMALEKNHDAAEAMVTADWEIASHGYRWLDYQYTDEDTEREHIKKSVEIIKDICGKRPKGIYQGKPNINTRRLIVEEGGFEYGSDAYSDDLPFWDMNFEPPHLVVPYSLETNDMRFCCSPGFTTGDQFFTYLRDAVDYLLEEGRQGSPKMLSVGLHSRIIGRPGRIGGLSKFLDYVKSKGRDVWICKREEIAEHWRAERPPKTQGRRYSSSWTS